MNRRSLRYTAWAAPFLGVFLLLSSGPSALLWLRILALVIGIVLLVMALKTHLNDLKKDHRPEEAPFWR